MKQLITTTKTSLRGTVRIPIAIGIGHGDEAMPFGRQAIPKLQRAHLVARGLLHAAAHGLALLFAMTFLERRMQPVRITR